VSTKTAKSEALDSLHRSDIIIGTKMLTTGFDLEDVGVVGVILLEQELSYPQYNKEEKVYTSLKQLIGRGERRWQNPDIVIQTFIPQNPLVKLITQANYKTFFTEVLKERKEFWYPPFTQMVTLDYRDSNRDKSIQFMLLLENKIQSLKQTKNSVVIRNTTPFKKNNLYHSTLTIKSENIRVILEQLEQEILKNAKLSLILE
jgi:primosomal protein N' (replication factor Y) (superfamily II helicase)